PASRSAGRWPVSWPGTHPGASGSSSRASNGGARTLRVRVKVALLADYSNVSREGKLNILGIFDTIYAPTFPTTHPHMQLVIRFEADAREAGATRQVEVQFRTQDGTVLFRLPGAMTVQPGELGETIRTDHILNVTNLNLGRAS